MLPFLNADGFHIGKHGFVPCKMVVQKPFKQRSTKSQFFVVFFFDLGASSSHKIHLINMQNSFTLSLLPFD